MFQGLIADRQATGETRIITPFLGGFLFGLHLGVIHGALHRLTQICRYEVFIAEEIVSAFADRRYARVPVLGVAERYYGNIRGVLLQVPEGRQTLPVGYEQIGEDQTERALLQFAQTVEKRFHVSPLNGVPETRTSGVSG